MLDPAAPDALQHDGREKRHAPLDDHENHRHGAELVVHREMTEEQLGQPHEMVTPRQQHGEQRDRGHPPFRPTAQHEQSQHGEQQRRSAHIDRTGRSGLGAPITGQMRCYLPRIVLAERVGHRSVLGKSALGRAAVQIGNKQIERLAGPVAPGRRILDVEPLLLLARTGLAQLASSAHRLGRMGIDVVEHACIAADSQYGGQGQQSGRLGEPGQRFRTRGRHELVDPERGQYEQEIVGDLRMVHADLDRREDARQRRTDPHVAPERVPHSPEQHRSESQRHHLGHMPRPYDNEEIGRKAVGQRRNDPDPRVEPHAQQHEKESRHGDEDQRGGLAEKVEGFRQRLDDGPLVLHVDQVSRHTPEHVAFPLRVLAVFLAVLHDILRRALVLLNIALEQRLSAELRSEIEQVDQNENGQSRRHGKPPSDIALVLHRDRLIDSDLQSNEKLSRFLCRTPLRAEIYRAAGPRPAPRFRIPNFASPPACRFRTGPAIPHARSGRILGPPAPPDCNRATAVLT